MASRLIIEASRAASFLLPLIALATALAGKACTPLAWAVAILPIVLLVGEAARRRSLASLAASLVVAAELALLVYFRVHG